MLKLMFDTVTGRLASVWYNSDSSVGFEDLKKVGDVSLPHRLCFDTYPNPSTFVVTSWNLTAKPADNLFEEPK